MNPWPLVFLVAAGAALLVYAGMILNSERNEPGDRASMPDEGWLRDDQND